MTNTVEEKYILWIGGMELCVFDDLKVAQDEADEWIARGYDDVIVEEIEQWKLKSHK